MNCQNFSLSDENFKIISDEIKRTADVLMRISNLIMWEIEVIRLIITALWKFSCSLLSSDGSEPRLGPGLKFFWRAQAWHFERVQDRSRLELNFLWRAQKIGTFMEARARLFQKGLSSGSARARLSKLELGPGSSFWGSTHHYYFLSTYIRRCRWSSV